MMGLGAGTNWGKEIPDILCINRKEGMHYEALILDRLE